MGARPMARVIQEHIKKPLADEVLFGKLKNGGHVRVVVTRQEGEQGADDQAAGDQVADDLGAGERVGSGPAKLGFEFLDGPVTPKPEKIPPVPRKSKRRGGGPRRAKPTTPRGDGGAPPPSRGSVPKIPLVKV